MARKKSTSTPKAKSKSKSVLAETIKRAIIGSTTRGMDQTASNVEFATAKTASVGTALESFTLEGEVQLDAEQKETFLQILNTLKDISASTKDTTNERAAVRKLLASLVAKAEMEIKDLQDELKIKERALADALKRETVTDEEIAVRTEEILTLKKEIEKQGKVAETGRKLDTGGGTFISAKEMMQRDIRSGLQKLFPGLSFQKKENEGFSEMVGRTLGGAFSSQENLFNAIFGKKTQGTEFEDLVQGQKTKQTAEDLKKGTMTGLFSKLEPLLERSVEIQEKQLSIMEENDAEIDRDQAEVTYGEQLEMFSRDETAGPEQLNLFNAPTGSIESSLLTSPNLTPPETPESTGQLELFEPSSKTGQTELFSDIAATALLRVPGKAKGGLVEGRGTPTGDNLLTRLSPGEFVMNAAATRGLGVGTLETLNRTGSVVDNITQQVVNAPPPPATPPVINNITTPGEAPRPKMVNASPAPVRTLENSFIRFQNKRFVNI